MGTRIRGGRAKPMNDVDAAVVQRDRKRMWDGPEAFEPLVRS